MIAGPAVQCHRRDGRPRWTGTAPSLGHYRGFVRARREIGPEVYSQRPPARYHSLTPVARGFLRDRGLSRRFSPAQLRARGEMTLSRSIKFSLEENLPGRFYIFTEIKYFQGGVFVRKRNLYIPNW